MNVISVRDNEEYFEKIKWYVKSKWASGKAMEDIYEDCFAGGRRTSSPLPQWYGLIEGSQIIGCAGLITNDFISRMDLYPWLCALYVEEGRRGSGYGKLLIDRAKEDAKRSGFSHLYLCTDHVGYYEHYGFDYMGTGYHPWGETSRIYGCRL